MPMIDVSINITVNDQPTRNAAAEEIVSTLVAGAPTLFEAGGSGNDYADIVHLPSGRAFRIGVFNYYGSIGHRLLILNKNGTTPQIKTIDYLAGVSIPGTIRLRALVSANGCMLYISDQWVACTGSKSGAWYSGGANGFDGLQMFDQNDTDQGALNLVKYYYKYSNEDVPLVPGLIRNGASGKYVDEVLCFFGSANIGARGFYRFTTGEYGFLSYNGGDGSYSMFAAV